MPEDAPALAAAAGDPSPLAAVCPHRFARSAGARRSPPSAAGVAHRRRGAGRTDAAAAGGGRRRAVGRGRGRLARAADARRVSFADFALRSDAPRAGRRRLAARRDQPRPPDARRAGGARGLPLAGYVVNRLAPTDDLAVATNEALLRDLTAVPCLGSDPLSPMPPISSPPSAPATPPPTQPRASARARRRPRPRPRDVLKRRRKDAP